MTDAILGHGTELKRGANKIGEVTNISGPGLTRATPEATSMDSTNGWQEFIGGLKDGGEVTFEVIYDPVDTTLAASSGLLSDIDGAGQTAAQAWSLVFPDTGNTTWSFNAWLTSVSPAIPVDDKIMLEVTLKVTGQPTLA